MDTIKKDIERLFNEEGAENKKVLQERLLKYATKWQQSTAKEIVEMLEKLKSKTILDDAWNEAFDTAIREINKRYNTP